MAGIIGAIGFNTALATERMSVALRHRGPPRIQMHGRLENGLLYSMQALGDALSDRPTHSSCSEIEAEDRRHGWFARARVDPLGSLTLTRDSVGSFPLFYGSNNARTLCAFAPERKALWTAGIQKVLRVEPGSAVTITSPKDVSVRSEACRLPLQARTLHDIDDLAHRLLALLRTVTFELINAPSGVAFSGGLDSSLLCCLISDATETTCYATGLSNSFDVKNAQHAARLLGIRPEVITFSIDDVERMLPHVIATIESCNPLHVALSIPQHVITQRAATDGYKTVVTGQGADELFAGYHKYQTLAAVEPQALNAVLEADVRNIAATNLERDNLTAAANSVNVLLPYLDPRVVSLGLSIDWTQKLRGGINKYVLRKAAKQALPTELVCKQKKAMQYGTGVTAALRRLARTFLSPQNSTRCSVTDYLRAIAEEHNIQVAA